MSETDDAIHAELKAAALKAGMVDLDGLKLADMTTVTLEADGSVRGVPELMATLKARWPDLFARHVRNMSEIERAAKLAELKRGPPPVPVETTKRATEMTELERREYLRKHGQRFG